MGTGVVFCFKFRFVPCAVVLLSLNGCRAFVGRQTLRQVREVSQNLATIKKERGIEKATTGSLVRIAHFGKEGEVREEAFRSLEETYPDKDVTIDKELPSEVEMKVLTEKLSEVSEKVDRLISSAQKKTCEAEEGVEKLQEKEIKLSQYEMIAFSIGGALLLSFVLNLLSCGFFAKIKRL